MTSLKEEVNQVFVDPAVASFALQLVTATREHPEIKLGISPRGSRAFIHAAKAYALVHGRTYVTPKDFQVLVPFVFAHRLMFHDPSLSKTQITELLNDIVSHVPIPVR